MTAMSASPVSRVAAAAEPARRVQDEWGVYDPEAAGMPALMRALDEEPPAPVVTSSANAPRQDDRRSDEPAASDTSPEHGGAAYERTQTGALYTLEGPVTCPECSTEIRTLRVLRVLRTQVSFTSTLPRRGYVILCPDCDRILSAELSGLV
jgi:hypothetical protein